MIRKGTFLHNNFAECKRVINSLDYNPSNWMELSISFTLALIMLGLSIFVSQL